MARTANGSLGVVEVALAKQPVVPSAPTIRTVAKQAGVAVSTVSRVINGGSASDATRQKVNQAIAELGFTPSLAAQGLANRRASAVGLVVNSTRGSWFSELIAGVEEALAGSRESVLIASLRLTGQYNQSVVVDWIRERRVDGLLFVRYSLREAPLVKAAAKAQIPVALIAPDSDARVQVTVASQNVEAGRLIGRHAVELGHERVAFISGPAGSRDSEDRLRGLSEVLAQAKTPLNPEAVTGGDSYYSETGALYAQAYCEVDQAIRPTLVIGANDAIALGFSKAVLQKGLRIPEDVSVAGFDNSPEAELFWPGLTSVAQPSREMAAGACKALLSHIDQSGEQPPENLAYPVNLIQRESCGPAPNR